MRDRNRLWREGTSNFLVVECAKFDPILLTTCTLQRSFFTSQGDRERHQEAAGRGERGVGAGVGGAVVRGGEAGAGAEEEGVRQVLQEILKHTQGLLQGGTVSAIVVINCAVCHHIPQLFFFSPVQNGFWVGLLS